MNASTLRTYRDNPMTFIESLRMPGAGDVPFRDAMAAFQRERFAALAPSLLAVVRGETPPLRRHWWEASKGGSKSSDAAAAMLYLLAMSPRMLRCAAGAADRDQAAELKGAAHEILNLNRWLSDAIEIQAFAVTNRRTESRLDILASDAASTHGGRPVVTIIDELSHIPDERKSFALTMADNARKMPHGLMLVTTNAGELKSWQWDWREDARQSADWSFHRRAEPAPWIAESDIEEARRLNSPARFRRLWQGEWVPAGGSEALRDDVLRSAIDDELEPMEAAEPGYVFSAGLDLSVRRDHSSLCVVAKSVGRSVKVPTGRVIAHEWGAHEPEYRHEREPGDGKVRLCYLKSWKPPKGGDIDLQAVEDEVAAVAARFRCPVLFDPFQAMLMSQRLSRRVRMIETGFTGANLSAMASGLIEAFNSRQVRLYRDEELIRDLERMQATEKSYGHRIEFVRDETGHGDRGTSFMLAVHGLRDLRPRGNERERLSRWLGIDGGAQ